MASIFKKGDALFGFFKSGRNKNGEIVFRPVLGRVFVLLAALAIVGWVSSAFALMLFVKHARGFDGGHYTDILFYPWRKEAYQTAWGEEFIEQGIALLEEGEFAEGIRRIQIGHTKSPSNLKARLLLAEIHSARGRPEKASEILREGIPYLGEDDLDYLRTTLRVLLHNQEDDAVLAIAENVLPDQPILTPRTQITALAAATAAFYRGSYDQSEDLLTDYDLTDHSEGRILLARIDWERGRQEEALDRLEKLASRLTKQDEVYMLLARYYRELGDHAKAHNYAVMRQVNNPLDAAPRIALLHSYHDRGEFDRVARETDRLLQDFKEDQEALMGLGEFAAQKGDAELCRRVFRTADTAGLPLNLFAILVSEAHLAAKEYQEAIWFLESHSDQNEGFADKYGALLNGVYAVAYLGLGDEERSEGYLKRLLNSRNLRAENFLVTSRRIMELGKKESARRLIQHAHNVDPRNQAALIELIRLDLELGRTQDLVSSIQKLLTMRKPPRMLLEDSIARLGGDQFLFLPDRHELLESIRGAITSSGKAPVTHS